MLTRPWLIVIGIALWFVVFAGVLFVLVRLDDSSCTERREATSSQTGGEDSRVITIVDETKRSCK